MKCPDDDCGLDKPELSGYELKEEATHTPHTDDCLDAFKGKCTCSKHSPTPWKRCAYAIWSNKIVVADCVRDKAIGVPHVRTEAECIANAELIVRAVNSHETLVKAVKHARNQTIAELQEALEEGNLENGMTICAIKQDIALYEETIAQAEEKV